METFALLRCAQTFGVPLVALRGVSDGRADLTRLEDWTSTLHDVDANLAKALDRLTAVLTARGLAALDPAPPTLQDAAHSPSPESLTP
jgi:adenosylhomocysteine nucleosidase